MNRRELLRITAYMTGATLSAPLISSILTGCEAENQQDFRGPYFFSGDQFERLEQLLDLILPRTDSPSATEVGVHRIIDQMVEKVYDADAQKRYQEGFTALNDFLGKDAEIEKNIQSIEKEPEKVDTQVRDAYLHLKQQAIAYYLSTEEIGKNYLNYLPIPGSYDPCISLEEAGGKAWTL